MNDVTGNPCRAAKLYHFGSDLTVNLAPDQNLLGIDLPLDRGPLADGQGTGVDVALDQAVHLHIALRYEVADDPQAGRDNGRNAILGVTVCGLRIL